MHITATSLILDGSNGAVLPPINGFRQHLASPESVTLAGVSGLHVAALSVTPGAQKPGPVLVVCEVGEVVQPHLVRSILHAVMFVDELQIILKNFESFIHLSQSIVRFPMLRQPLLVYTLHLFITSPCHMFVILEDGHVNCITK